MKTIQLLGLTKEQLTFDPNGRHHYGAGLHIRQMSLPAGKTSITHNHEHDHLSVLASGSCVIRGDGSERVLHGPTCVPILAGIHYAITAQTDVEWFCISDDKHDEFIGD